MPWTRPPVAAPVPEPAYEAMALELNPRGSPYTYCGLSFPPGEWVPVTTSQAETLAWHDAVTVRPHEAAAPPSPAEEAVNV